MDYELQQLLDLEISGDDEESPSLSNSSHK